MDKNRDFEHLSLILMDALIHGKNVQEIMDLCCDFLKNPLYLGDIHFNVIAYSKNLMVDNPVWDELISHPAPSYEQMMQLKESGAPEMVYKSGIPVLISGDKFPTRGIVGKILINKKPVGYICVLEAGKEFEEADIDMIKLICDTMAIIIQKDSLFGYINTRQHEALIFDLLDGKKQRYYDIDEKLKHIGLRCSEYLFAAVISPTQGDSENNSLPYFIELLKYLIKDCKFVIYNNNIVMLISRNNDDPFPKAELKKLHEFLREKKMHCGLSRSFTNITDLRENYLQAVKAMELGVYMKHKKSLFAYDDYAPFHMLDLLSAQANLKHFCSPLLTKLMEYDSQKKTNYTLTLQVFLSCGNNAAESANRLNIHRNTLDYRIAKIEELLNIQLSDKNLTFYFDLSFKILEFIHGANFLNNKKIRNYSEK